MKAQKEIPVFAIIGHPNEGKSSVLSTLAEDDSVRVSPVPGETKACQEFPVVIDGNEVICFVDTPGFQNPRNTLKWMKAYKGKDEQMIEAFIAAHLENQAYRDDCELLKPVAAGAGVIFVVDGSRPVRNVDRAEMEILRLSGAPRMAVINSKEEDEPFLEQWHAEFRKHFNAIRIFNSFRATYIQRVELLESLKFIDQQWEPALRNVVDSFKVDWQFRMDRTADIMLSLLAEVLGYSKKVYCSKEKQAEMYDTVWQTYHHFLNKKEKQAQQQIRRLFKPIIFNLTLPEHSLLHDDLFSKATWDFLGLTDKQVILAGAMSGAALGAGVDLAAGGISFGVFSAIGTLVGGIGTALKGKQWLAEMKILGMKAGGEQLQIGPVDNIQLMYILLDRCLLFYTHTINWAHGRRVEDVDHLHNLNEKGKEGYTSLWTKKERDLCRLFFEVVRKEKGWEEHAVVDQLRSLLKKQMREIAENR